jgi:tetratricopeptide (TPR) repeat protein
MAKRIRSTKKSAQQNLAAQLTRLETAQLVRHIGEEEATYMFRHALTQDAAYQSLLVKQRREIHRRVAQAYEAQYGDRCHGEFAAILARHYAEAGDKAQASQYAMRAGDASFHIYALQEAVAYYSMALDLARHELSIDSQILVRLYHQRGQVLYSDGQFQAAWDNYVEMETVAHARSDRVLEMHSLIERGTVSVVYGPFYDAQAAIDLNERAQEIARELNDRAALAKILWNSMRAMTQQNIDALKAIRYGEESLAIARAENLREQYAYTLGDLQYAYRGAERIEDALKALEQARPLWYELGNLHMAADNLNQAAIIYSGLGNNAQCEKLSTQALDLSLKTNNEAQLILSSLILGSLHCWRGEMVTALAYLAKIEGKQTMWSTGPSAVLFANIYGELGDTARALDKMQSVFEQIRNSALFYFFSIGFLGEFARVLLMEGRIAQAQLIFDDLPKDFPRWLAVVIAGANAGLIASVELKLAQGKLVDALTEIDSTIDNSQRLGLRGWHAEMLFTKAQVLIAQENWIAAHETLMQARESAEQLNGRRLLWRIYGALAQIEKQLDHIEQANAYRARSREMIQFIADHSPAGLRESFLNLPDVRRVMETKESGR